MSYVLHCYHERAADLDPTSQPQLVPHPVSHSFHTDIPYPTHDAPMMMNSDLTPLTFVQSESPPHS